MIDLHSHILPGIDDGPADLAGSVALARAAAADGTEVMAATPHLREDHPEVRVWELAGRCEKVQTALIDAGIGMEVVPAAEVDLMWASTASAEEMRMASYGQRGTDMLVETPYGQLPPGFDELLFRISVQGIRILLAHPERNPSFQRRPERVVELVERGILVQLTANSVLSTDRSSRSRRVAHWLVEQGAAHVIASDSHSAGPWRPPDLAVAMRTLALTDSARAEWMVNEVPPAILAGAPLPEPPRRSAAKLGGRLFGRRRD